MLGSQNKTLWVLLLSLFISACGSESQNEGTDEDPLSTTPIDAATQAKIDAAEITAARNASCISLGPFFWEIGDKNGRLTSQSMGNGSVLSSTSMSIASASKWLFGAYVQQMRGGSLSLTDKKALTMTSGYGSLNNFSCAFLATVDDCFNAGSNSNYTPSEDGKFDYDSGHFQKWAHDNGLGSLTAAQLGPEFMNKLGSDLNISFNSLLLAGSASMDASHYARFLRKLLNQQLVAGEHLGEDAVCTLPSACVSAIASPSPEDWHYSLGHWVEDDPTNGDAAYSSPGALGFYPWIDASQTFYGIVARQSGALGASIQSVICGREIRKAFISGVARP